MERHDGLKARPSQRDIRALVRWSVVVLMTPLLVFFTGPSVSLLQADEPAQQDSGPPKTLMEKLNTRGDLTIKERSIAEAIYTISDTWDINIVVQSDIRGEVNCVFSDAPLKEILDSLLLINGYSYRPVGESLVVMSLNEVGQFSQLFTTEIIPLRYGVPAEIVTAVELLKSPRGKIQTIASSRSLMVVDFPRHVEMIRKLALQLDNAAGRQAGNNPTAGERADGVAAVVANQRIEVGHFKLQYVRAPHLEKTIADLLSTEGKSSIIEKENRIVVADYPDKLRVVADAIRHLDLPRQQVRIAAIIYDISLEDIEEIGINWNSALKGNSRDADNNPLDVFAIDSITQVPPALGAANGIMTFMSLSQNFDITAVVNALQQSDDSRLLADPNVTVLDNDQAKIEIVTEIPYQALTQTSGGGNIGTTSFREAGVTLEVTPRIAADGTIEMDVTPSFSRLTGFTPGDNQPIIDRRQTSTTIRVADLQTIVIGGLRQRTDIGDFTGIPILKDIPIAGKLFRNRETTVRESELVVFITPMIVPFDECPQGRYGAALDTANCWLHRVPWAEGCPPPGHPGGPEACDVCEEPCDVTGTQDVIYGDDVQSLPERLPAVEEPVPPPPPADYTSRSSRRNVNQVEQDGLKVRVSTGPAASSRRVTSTPSPVYVAPKSPSIPPRPVMAQVQDASRPKSAVNQVRPRKAVSVDKAKEVIPAAKPTAVPRIKLAGQPSILPHNAPVRGSNVPRRLPPVVKLTQYEAAAVGSRSRTEAKRTESTRSETPRIETRRPTPTIQPYSPPAHNKTSQVDSGRQPPKASSPVATRPAPAPRVTNPRIEQPVLRSRVVDSPAIQKPAPQRRVAQRPTTSTATKKEASKKPAGGVSSITSMLKPPAEPLRKPYGQRYRSSRIGDMSLIEGQPPKRLPPVARNPSESPEAASRRTEPTNKKSLPAVFDAFRP